VKPIEIKLMGLEMNLSRKEDKPAPIKMAWLEK